LYTQFKVLYIELKSGKAGRLFKEKAMVLIQNENVLLEYEEKLELLYYERRGTGNGSGYREAINQALSMMENKNVRFWLINAADSNRFRYEDQTWLLEKLEESFTQNHTLEKVALIPSRDHYTLMTTESILEYLMEKRKFEFQYFSDVASARDWLEESYREVCFYDEGLEIEYDACHHWIYANLKGNHDFASMKRVCELMLDLLVAKGCNKLLIDNRLALGAWSEATPWILQDYVPRLEQNGLRAVAWTLSPSTVHRLNSLDLVHSLSTSIQVQVFNDFSAAKHWLSTFQGPIQDQIAFPETETENQK
jgi:hypothetical protein